MPRRLTLFFQLLVIASTSAMAATQLQSRSYPLALIYDQTDPKARLLIRVNVIRTDDSAALFYQNTKSCRVPKVYFAPELFGVNRPLFPLAVERSGDRIYLLVALAETPPSLHVVCLRADGSRDESFGKRGVVRLPDNFASDPLTSASVDFLTPGLLGRGSQLLVGIPNGGIQLSILRLDYKTGAIDYSFGRRNSGISDVIFPAVDFRMDGMHELATDEIVLVGSEVADETVDGERLAVSKNVYSRRLTQKGLVTTNDWKKSRVRATQGYLYQQSASGDTVGISGYRESDDDPTSILVRQFNASPEIEIAQNNHFADLSTALELNFRYFYATLMSPHRLEVQRLSFRGRRAGVGDAPSELLLSGDIKPSATRFFEQATPRCAKIISQLLVQPWQIGSELAED